MDVKPLRRLGKGDPEALGMGLSPEEVLVRQLFLGVPHVRERAAVRERGCPLTPRCKGDTLAAGGFSKVSSKEGVERMLSHLRFAP